MTRIFNRAEHTEKRRELRRNLAPAEALPWSRLQRRQLLGYKFRRQYGVGAYVVDFYCPALQLAIEVDGDSHCGEEAAQRDARRQQWIEGFGIRFVRYLDTDLLSSTDAVIDHLIGVIQQLEMESAGTAGKGNGRRAPSPVPGGQPEPTSPGPPL